MYPNRYECITLVDAPCEAVFAFVDDQSKLSSHMSKRSWMMGGGAMTIATDSMQGKSVGSKMELAGVVWGLKLHLAEVVTERTPPVRKVWETIDIPRLLVIGSYQMGADIEPCAGGSQLRVFINYALPATWPERWFGLVFGRSYAKWCVVRMAHDAAEYFRKPRD